MTSHTWIPAEIEHLRTQYPHRPTSVIAATLKLSIGQIYAKATRLGLRKSPEYLASPDACRLRRGDKIGEAGRFQKGLTPWNKGMKGLHIGGAETQFKPGHRPHTWRPIGTERTSDEGYLQRKMTDTGCTRRDYVNVHWLIWLAAGNKIPPGHVLVFRDGNTRHITLDNLELITRRELMARNTVHNLPKPLAQLVQLRGALVRKINRLNQIKEEYI